MSLSGTDSHIFTYQTRLTLDDELLSIFFVYADLVCSIERTLFADLQRGIDPSKLKSDYLKRFDITARQFNSVRVLVEGKIASIACSGCSSKMEQNS